jgi:hypothetical protein
VAKASKKTIKLLTGYQLKGFRLIVEVEDY